MHILAPRPGCKSGGATSITAKSHSASCMFPPARCPLNLRNPPRKILRSHDGQFNKSVCRRSGEVNYVYRTSKCIHEGGEVIQNPCGGGSLKRGHVSTRRPCFKAALPVFAPTRPSAPGCILALLKPRSCMHGMGPTGFAEPRPSLRQTQHKLEDPRKEEKGLKFFFPSTSY